MKKYSFVTPDENFDAIVEVLTEEEILERYWEFWRGKMVKKFGENSELITKENCIDDWVCCNWAKEEK